MVAPTTMPGWLLILPTDPEAVSMLYDVSEAVLVRCAALEAVSTDTEKSETVRERTTL